MDACAVSDPVGDLDAALRAVTRALADQLTEERDIAERLARTSDPAVAALAGRVAAACAQVAALDRRLRAPGADLPGAREGALTPLHQALTPRLRLGAPCSTGASGNRQDLSDHQWHRGNV